jgi:uncharacterized protein
MIGDSMADRSNQFDNGAPVLIAIGGLSGSGKTTLAQTFGMASRRVLIDSNRMLKEMLGVSPTAKLPPQAYTAKIRQRLSNYMNRRCRDHLRAGRSVVLSQTFVRAESRARAEDMANELGVAFHGIWLDTDLETQFKRVTSGKGGIPDSSPQVILKQAQILASSGPVRWTVIDARQPADAVLREAAQQFPKLRLPPQ